jgi:hypothetical protein
MITASAQLRRQNPPRHSHASLFLALVLFLVPSRVLCGSDIATKPAEVGRGLSYKNDRIPNVPWSIHVIKIDRSRSDFELITTHARGTALGLATLTEQINSVPSAVGKPIAAINGDFYRTEQEPYAGDPRGLQILLGELLSAPSGKTCFWIDLQGNPQMTNVIPQFKVIWPDGRKTTFGLNEERDSGPAVLYTPRLGSSTRTSGGRELILERDAASEWLPLRAGETYSARVREVRETGNSRLSRDIMVLSLSPDFLSRVPTVEPGAVLKISTVTSPDLKGVRTAIGGGPVLVHDGKAQPGRVNKSLERHPRSAIGWNEKFIFLVEVDGRQGGLSIGMTLPELAAYLVKEGCEEAMNLDGGGSAEVWVNGQIASSPCFGHERSTANALVLVQKEKNPGR